MKKDEEISQEAIDFAIAELRYVINRIDSYGWIWTERGDWSTWTKEKIDEIIVLLNHRCIEGASEALRSLISRSKGCLREFELTHLRSIRHYLDGVGLLGFKKAPKR